MKTFLRVTLAALTGAIISVPVMAADLDPVIYADDANFVKPAQLGSSWYLRGEIGYNINGVHDVTAYGNPAEATYYDNNITDRLNFNMGVGYRISPMFRVDASIGRLAGADYSQTALMYAAGTEPAGTDPSLIVDPLDPNPCNGWGEFVNTSTGVTFIGDDFITNCISTDTAEYDITYGMMNAYVDLPTMGRFQPFFGLGAGLSRISWREEIGSVDCIPREEDIRAEGCRAYGVADQPGGNEPYTQPGTVNEGVDYRLGGQVSAGIGYQLTDNMTIDTTYRYTYFGGQSLSFGSGSQLNADGFGTHQVNVGFRYSLF